MSGADPGRQAGGDKWGDDIPPERQAELEALFQRQAEWAVTPVVERGKGAFMDVRLTGADVFWLAARVLAGTNEVQATAGQMEQLRRAWDDLRLRSALKMDGLHLEGANLSKARLTRAALGGAHLTRADLTAAHLEDAILDEAYLEGAALGYAHLTRAFLAAAHLTRADLTAAHLERADLNRAHLEAADLVDAHLEGAHLSTAHLETAGLRGAHLESADLSAAHFERADLTGAHLEHASLKQAHLEGADLAGAHLEHASLDAAHLGGAALRGAHLERAVLRGVHLEGRAFGPDDKAEYGRLRQLAIANGHFWWVRVRGEDAPSALDPADLRAAFLDSASDLTDVTFGRPGLASGQGFVRVADVRWGGVNLAVIKDWPPNMVLGDEREARSRRLPKREGTKSPYKADKKSSRQERAEARRQQEEKWKKELAEAEQKRLELFRAAVRANRQLGTALREQGMNEEADRFAYRAQVCQRQVFRLRHQHVRAAFSWLLDAISGHGYQPAKTLAWYLGILAVFACAYFAATHGLLTFGLPPSQIQPLPWYEALVLSVSSFHGRGFFQPVQSLGDPVAILAAIEAVFGLFIEVSFIATFTQRYFGK